MNERKELPATPGWQAELFDFDDWLSRHEFRPARQGRSLLAGDRVRFDLGTGDDGPPYAMNVKVIDPD
jgi:hypothetical protein